MDRLVHNMKILQKCSKFTYNTLKVFVSIHFRSAPTLVHLFAYFSLSSLETTLTLSYFALASLRTKLRAVGMMSPLNTCKQSINTALLIDYFSKFSLSF